MIGGGFVAGLGLAGLWRACGGLVAGLWMIGGRNDLRQFRKLSLTFRAGVVELSIEATLRKTGAKLC